MTRHDPRETFILAGQTLYGTAWMIPMAKALRYNRRTIERWATGFTPVPVDIWPDVLKLCDSHVEKIQMLGCRIAGHVGLNQP